MNKPTIICLWGSTRFWREFQRVDMQETLAGKIVLSIPNKKAAGFREIRLLSK